MATKPDAQDWIIKEQIIEDLASELTFQFEVRSDGTKSMKIFGNLPFGNRTIIFDQNGEDAGGGTRLTDCPGKATWIKEMK